MALDEDIPRNLKSRLLRDNIPKPNVVRIELLSSVARQRYLGQIQKWGDSLRGYVTENMNREEMLKNRIFYGTLKGGADIGINMSSEWVDSQEMAKLWAATKEVAGKAVDKVGRVVGTAIGGFVGGASGAQAVGNVGGNTSSVIGDAVDIITELTQMSSNATGSASVKKFKSVSVSDYTIEVGWYLPEQYNLCKHSMKILYHLIYPMQASFDGLDGNNKPGNFTELSAKLDLELSRAKSSSSKNSAAENAYKIDSSVPTDVGLFGVATSYLDKATRVFGHNLTFDPLPVRLCVGQSVDLEPLVITSVKTSTSPELFVSREGKHLPVFVSAQIGFKMWLNPRPDMQWLKFLGDEMFGPDTATEVKKKTQSQESDDFWNAHSGI